MGRIRRLVSAGLAGASLWVAGCGGPMTALSGQGTPRSDDATPSKAEPRQKSDASGQAAERRRSAVSFHGEGPRRRPASGQNQARLASSASALSLWGELPTGPSDAGPRDASVNLSRVSFTDQGADFDVDVAPSGKQVVFASTRHRKTPDLYVKNTTGHTATQLTSDPGSDVMPAVSPDGQRIAFASNRDGGWDLYVIPADGGQPTQLTSAPAAELHPSWGPDGQRIIFSSRSGNGRWQMTVIDVSQPAQRKFIGFGLFPVFSPDGKKIAFQRARNRGSRRFSVWSIDYADGEGKRPTEIAAAENAAVIGPAWSPDGRRLTFATVLRSQTGSNRRHGPRRKPESADLWAINLDGTNRIKLTNDAHANLQPNWGADGRIYFISDRSGTDNIWALEPASGATLAGPSQPAKGEPQAKAR